MGSFSSPLYVTAPPKDYHRLFVVERAGRVRLLKDWTTLTEPFLDISADVDAAVEGGLILIAFPSNYTATGRFYALYTDSVGIRVAEFRRSKNDPDRAAPATRRVLLTQPHSINRYHYAGQLQFGPDHPSTSPSATGAPRKIPTATRRA